MDQTLERMYVKILGKMRQDFDSKIIRDPDFGGQLPDNCHIIFNLRIVETNDPDFLDFASGFNEWTRELSLSQLDDGQPVVVAQLHVPYLPVRRSLKKTLFGEASDYIPQSLFDAVPRDFILQAA